MSENSSLEAQRELWQRGARDNAALLREEMMVLWQQEARVCRVIAHLDNDGSRELGYPSTTALVAEVARTTSGAVRKLVARALAINPSQSVGARAQWWPRRLHRHHPARHPPKWTRSGVSGSGHGYHGQRSQDHGV
ncbi:hypothetical protein [Amycolatopsis minnesotensis]|uniref:DUF222 domain-containing protein n=1 Tax=Amycolatopsis minnesotensis TaxID=337894 RepID=A0ABP5DZB1_9PSEU